MNAHPLRLIFNDDASNFLYRGDNLGADDLRRYLARLDETHVDLVAYCVAFGGYVCYYESEVAEPVGTGFGYSDRVKQLRWTRNRRRLREEAGDYVGLAFHILREMGLPAVASIRMNDAHMSSDPAGPVAGRFWMNHPEWRLGEEYGYYRSCLDYARAPVRAYVRRLAQEVMEKFPDIDGLELDFMRSPYFFKPGQGAANAHLITELMRAVRGDLDAAARERGRPPYLLRANVPRTPELALECGLDVAAWAAEGLIDGVSPGCYNTDFQPAVESWRAALGDRVLVHPYFNCGASPGTYHSLEQFRAAAANAYGAGADGVYLFNFPCLDELRALIPQPIDRPVIPPPRFPAQCWHPDLDESTLALKELGDPDLLARRGKHYLFYMSNAAYRHYTPERASIERLQPEPAELVFRCYHAAAASACTLKLKAVSVTVFDEFAFSFNGRPLSADRVQRLHAPGGRDTRVHSVPLDPYSEFVIDLDAGWFAAGENALTVSLVKADPDLFSSIALRELELILRYE